MPVTTSYPGIYVQELPSSQHTVSAAPTNIAVFIGYTHPLKNTSYVNALTNLPQASGSPAPIPVPQLLFGFSDFQRVFGGFVRSAVYANDATGSVANYADMATAVNQFFLNGGTEVYVVGLQPDAITSGTVAPPTLGGGAAKIYGTVVFTAREVTDAAPAAGSTSPQFQLSVQVTQNGTAPTADVVVTYGPNLQANAGGPLQPGTVVETYRRVSLTPTLAGTSTPDPNFIETRIGTAANPISALVTVAAAPTTTPATTPAWPATFPTGPEYFAPLFPAGTTSIFSALDFDSAMGANTPLDKLPVFNLMVLPGVSDTTVLSTALAFCENKLAFLIMDPPPNATADNSGGSTTPISGFVTNIPKSANGALYFPYLQSPDPLTGLATNPVTGAINTIPPAASVAGIFAATDVARGVWKAPAGYAATTRNTTGVVPSGRMTNLQQGTLNPLGINCLRDFPNIGTAVFGARTLVTLTNQQWRYVPVRRMALFLEQSLISSLTWVVFEPNAEPLWTAIRVSITAFMLGYYNQNAFAGTTPSDSFLVKCDSQTTTPTDQLNGIVNVLVGFAPLEPAEFVIISISQIAGQSPAG